MNKRKANTDKLEWLQGLRPGDIVKVHSHIGGKPPSSCESKILRITTKEDSTFPNMLIVKNRGPYSIFTGEHAGNFDGAKSWIEPK